ncbi:hypothetical protein D6D17_05585 [Aureobasidium pullulans]|nr:hypothetical protein D6D17_05585 [Aureobasidium pullulans]
MTSYLASYIPAIKSIIPQSSPSVAALPEVGEQAPARVGSVDLKSGGRRPTLLAFVRHCGCPFAEKEVQLLGAESRKNEKLHVVIVQHSDEATTQQWFEDIGGKKAFPDSQRYTLVADPERKAYAAWGVGSLGWGGMVNGGVMEALKSLKESDGIDLRPTGVGSYRWQNSGGFAVDSAGTIRWRKIAKDSSDIGGKDDYGRQGFAEPESPVGLCLGLLQVALGWFVGHVVCKQRFQRPFILSSIIFAPEAIAKAVTPHDILDMLQRHPQEFYEPLFLLTRYSILVTPRTKEFLSQQLLSKNGHHKCKSARLAIRQKRLAVLSFERCLDPTNPLVRTRSLKTRELIPEDVKFFNSTVNASTAIVRGYICLRLLVYFRKRKIL